MGHPWNQPVEGKGVGLAEGVDGLSCWWPEDSLAVPAGRPGIGWFRVVLTWAKMAWPSSPALIRLRTWVTPGRSMTLGKAALQSLKVCPGSGREVGVCVSGIAEATAPALEGSVAGGSALGAAKLGLAGLSPTVEAAFGWKNTAWCMHGIGRGGRCFFAAKVALN